MANLFDDDESDSFDAARKKRTPPRPPRRWTSSPAPIRIFWVTRTSRNPCCRTACRASAARARSGRAAGDRQGDAGVPAGALPVFRGAEKQEAGLFGKRRRRPAACRPEHPAFHRVASSGHADLVTVEREFDEKKGRLKTEISVEAVRRIHPFLRMTAAEGGWAW